MSIVGVDVETNDSVVFDRIIDNGWGPGYCAGCSYTYLFLYQTDRDNRGTDLDAARSFFSKLATRASTDHPAGAWAHAYINLCALLTDDEGEMLGVPKAPADEGVTNVDTAPTVDGVVADGQVSAPDVQAASSDDFADIEEAADDSEGESSEDEDSDSDQDADSDSEEASEEDDDE